MESLNILSFHLFFKETRDILGKFRRVAVHQHMIAFVFFGVNIEGRPCNDRVFPLLTGEVRTDIAGENGYGHIDFMLDHVMPIVGGMVVEDLTHVH